MDGTTCAKTHPAEGYRKLDMLSCAHIEILRNMTKKIQDARIARNNVGIKQHLKEYDEALNQYTPVLMTQANIYWERQHFKKVEEILRQSAEWSAEDPVWRLNLAHTFFVQDMWKEAMRYYEPLVKKHDDDLHSLKAITVANLCVCYIMSSRNEDGEELMRRVENEEDTVERYKDKYHLCIINLVIGTLYCSKGNFHFGLSRIIKALEPYDKRLSVDTWFYTKRCLLAYLEQISKRMIYMHDDSYDEVMGFLDEVETHGKDIRTVIGTVDEHEAYKSTISYEARRLKLFFIQMKDC